MAMGRLAFRQADIAMALLLMLILSVLLVPVPIPILDALLVLSIGSAVLVLVITTQLKDPLELSAFPSLLLILTLFRLALNVAVTRQILLTGYGGHVVQSFGTFVVGGNYVVGAVIFLILVIINFMVITKGSGRIAEVAARFTLDAMPGKQMSIDADLNAGLIDEKEAIARRKKLMNQSDFYGAMDGASKFVRGDAIAGLIITALNIVGGFAVGMLQQGMGWQAALQTYTILTIGDGLVSQIPALIISTSSGMLVTRAASDDTLGTDVGRQIMGQSAPMVITGAVLAAISLVPGMPFIPFCALGGIIGGLGLTMHRKVGATAAAGGVPAQAAEPAAAGRGAGRRQAQGGAGTAKALHAVSAMDLEIGFGLVPLVDRNQGGRLIDRIGMVREQLADELGFVLPPVNVRDNIGLKNTEYCIKVRGLETARGTVRPGMLMAINPGTAATLEGFPAAKDPAFGFDAYWIGEDKRDLAESKGLTVVDCASVVTTHLAEEAKRNAAEILGRQDVSNMIDQLKETHPSLVQDLNNNKVSMSLVHRVLGILLRERVPIRDLPLIVETILDHVGRTQDSATLAEYCRRALGGHICRERVAVDGSLPAIGVHPDLENIVRRTVHREGSDAAAPALDPALAHEVLESIRKAVAAIRQKSLEPVLLCSPVVRAPLRMLTEHDLRDTAVISFAEVPDRIKVNMLALIPPPAGPRLEQAAAQYP
jgi:flagellar biosynthesis protein FlhA